MDVKVLAAIVTAIATILAFLLNVGFTHFVLPKIQSSRKKKGILDEYGYALARVTRSNIVYLNMFLKNRTKGWVCAENDEYFRLSLLYTIGEFLGWWRIIETKAYLEFASPESDGSSLNHRGLRIFKAMNSFDYHGELSSSEVEKILKTTIPRRAAQAMGELMIDPQNGQSIISFSEFCERYESDKKYQKWFRFALRLFEQAESKNDIDHIERIELMLCAFDIFHRNLLRLIGTKTEPISEIDLRSCEHMRNSVKINFLHNYRKEGYEIKIGPLSNKSVKRSTTEQLALILES